MQSYRAVFSALPVLETERLILRKLSGRDTRDVYAYASDEEVARHVLWTAHKSIGETRSCIRAARRQYRLGMPATFAIELKEQHRVIGTIGFTWVNTDFQSAEVGYSLGRAYWNQGLATEALKEVLRFAFDTLALNRVEAMHELDNPASGRVMRKAGMHEEGILRERVRNKGQYRDVRLWSILRQEWYEQNTSQGDKSHV